MKMKNTKLVRPAKFGIKLIPNILSWEKGRRVGIRKKKLIEIFKNLIWENMNAMILSSRSSFLKIFFLLKREGV